MKTCKDRKNVNIITIHKEPNYGAVLQAFALYKTVQQLGGNPRMVDLSMDYRQLPYNLVTRFAIQLKNHIRGYDNCFRIAEKFGKLHYPNRIGDFHSLEELDRYEWNRDDIYIVGSDQVWNPEIAGNLLKAYTLSFLDEGYHKYSYASSLGNIRDAALRAEQLDLASLRSFKKIAVRERFGVEFLKNYGISAVETIDPTLLLEDYSFLFDRPVVNHHRLLFLSLSDTAPMNEFVDRISHRTHLPIEKHYGYLQPSRRTNGKFLDVVEWLYKIATSSLIITDSFHAMVFSILFKRPFYVYISEPSKIQRIASLLDSLNIRGRIAMSVDDELCEQDLDYENVLRHLSDYRKQSLEYLSSILAAE